MKNDDIYKILLIEDDDEDAFFLEELLKQDFNFKFHLSRIPLLKNLEEVKDKNFNIVLTDMNLPDSTGLETVKSVINQLPETPVIVLTGNTDEEVGLRSLEIGSEDYLVKGQLSCNQLIKAIKFAISRKSIKDELQLNKNLLQNTFNSSPINLILIDHNKTILEINNNAKKLCSVCDDYLGMELFKCMGVIDLNPFKKLEDIIDETIIKKQAVQDLQIELPLSKDRNLKSGIYIISTAYIEDGKQGKILIGLNEITELEIAKKRAIQANEYKNNFIANMSHEIRTPMNGVIGFSELLKENEISGDKKDKFLDIIIKNGQQLLSLIDDIIDISKIESNDLIIRLKPWNINEILIDLKELYEKIKKQKDKEDIQLDLQTSHIHERILIKTDGHRLKQIFSNLLDNALKFTKEGKISFGYELKEDMIEFFVEDTGRGIPEDQLEEIFQRFKQIRYEDSVQLGGTGLGLAIVNGIIRLMGGTINVNSVLNKGTRFTFTIPNAIVNKTRKKREFSENLLQETLKDKNILIVDDEEFIQYFFKEVFRKYQCKLFFASNGIEAIESYKSHRIDLVLMDLRMPNMNGFKAANEILIMNPDAIIIAQTAYALPEEKDKCLNLGCKEYITKPIVKKVLFESIINIL